MEMFGIRDYRQKKRLDFLQDCSKPFHQIIPVHVILKDLRPLDLADNNVIQSARASLRELLGLLELTINTYVSLKVRFRKEFLFSAASA